MFIAAKYVMKSIKKSAVFAPAKQGSWKQGISNLLTLNLVAQDLIILMKIIPFVFDED